MRPNAWIQFMVMRGKMGGQWPPSAQYRALPPSQKQKLKDSAYYFNHRNRNAADLTLRNNSFCRYFTRENTNDVDQKSQPIDVSDTRSISENVDNKPHKIMRTGNAGDYYSSLWEKSVMLCHRKGVPYEIQSRNVNDLNRYVKIMAEVVDYVYFRGTLLPSLQPLQLVSNMLIFDLGQNGLPATTNNISGRLADTELTGPNNNTLSIRVFWNAFQDDRFHMGMNLPHNAFSFPAGAALHLANYDGRVLDSMLASVMNVVQHELVHAMLLKHCDTLNATVNVNEYHNLTFNDMNKMMWGKGQSTSFMTEMGFDAPVTIAIPHNAMRPFSKVGGLRLARFFTNTYIKARRIKVTHAEVYSVPVRKGSKKRKATIRMKKKSKV